MPTKCPRSRRRWIKLGILAAPFLAWLAIILIVPTGWAKARLTARLAQSTGRSVRIGSLCLGMLGNLRVREITIAEPESPQDPWVSVPEAQIDIHLGQILMGRCSPGEVRLLNPSIRILRSPDGTWECGKTNRANSGAQSTAEHAKDASSGTTSLVIEGGTIRFDDRSGGIHFDVADVSGRGTIARALASIEELRGAANGGEISLAARVEDDAGLARFEAEVRVRSVAIDSGFDGLDHLVPVIAGANDGVRGTLDLDLAGNGRGRSFEEAMRSLRGHGSFSIADVDLDGSKFLSELDVLGDWPSTARVGTLSCDYTIAGRRASSENLTLRVDRFPLVLAGWTDFDGRFDYGVRADLMTAMLPRDARGWLKEVGVNFEQLAGIRIHGSPAHLAATLNGHPIRDEGPNPVGGIGGGRDDDRSRLRETARRIRERFFR